MTVDPSTSLLLANNQVTGVDGMEIGNGTVDGVTVAMLSPTATTEALIFPLCIPDMGHLKPAEL